MPVMTDVPAAEPPTSSAILGGAAAGASTPGTGAATVPRLLGALLPSQQWTPAEATLLARLARVAETELAPRAVANDSAGRYPTEGIAALRAAGLTAVSV